MFLSDIFLGMQTQSSRVIQFRPKQELHVHYQTNNQLCRPIGAEKNDHTTVHNQSSSRNWLFDLWIVNFLNWLVMLDWNNCLACKQSQQPLTLIWPTKLRTILMHCSSRQMIVINQSHFSIPHGIQSELKQQTTWLSNQRLPISSKPRTEVLKETERERKHYIKLVLTSHEEPPQCQLNRYQVARRFVVDLGPPTRYWCHL